MFSLGGKDGLGVPFMRRRWLAWVRNGGVSTTRMAFSAAKSGMYSKEEKDFNVFVYCSRVTLGKCHQKRWRCVERLGPTATSILRPFSLTLKSTLSDLTTDHDRPALCTTS